MTGLAVVFMLAIVEAALHLLGFVVHTMRPRGADDPLLHRPGFAGRAWVPGYLAEFEQLDERFVPFVDWQYREFHGEAINIGSDGNRATDNPEFAPGDRPLEVFVFGGSTVWGTGSRDRGTIPSALSRALNAADCRARVTNYGQSAWTSLQGIVRLMLLLREGKHPDLVIVYDGVNDTYGAYQSGVPGTNQNVAEMEAILHDKRSSFEHFRHGLSGLLREHSMIYRAIRGGADLARAAINPHTRFRETGASMSPADLEKLSEGIVAEYWRNQDILDRLAASYGIRVLRFWQPSAYAQNWQGAAAVDLRATDTALRDLYRSVSARLPDDPSRRFTNLSQLFAGQEDSVFVDFVHISEEGNAVVAARMVQALRGVDGEGWCGSPSTQGNGNPEAVTTPSTPPR